MQTNHLSGPPSKTCVDVCVQTVSEVAVQTESLDDPAMTSVTSAANDRISRSTHGSVIDRLDHTATDTADLSLQRDEGLEVSLH